MKLRLLVFAFFVVPSLSAQDAFRLPKLQPPPRYGNVTINRGTAGGGTPVVFAHWSHRMRYTCRVCHLELGFAMQRNATEITQKAIRDGEYCGACHDGKTAFGVSDDTCARCHVGKDDAPVGAFLEKTASLPSAAYGNRIDWTLALASGKIKPVSSRYPGYEPMVLDATLSLEAEWNFVPPAIFPHAEHARWLDCANCHPSIFNVKKKTTRHFSMRRNLSLEFCGVCHVRVAFPMNDCKRCHPKMEQMPVE